MAMAITGPVPGRAPHELSYNYAKQNEKQIIQGKCIGKTRYDDVEINHSRNRFLLREWSIQQQFNGTPHRQRCQHNTCDQPEWSALSDQ